MEVQEDEEKNSCCFGRDICCLPGYFLSDMPWEPGDGTGKGEHEDVQAHSEKN